MSDGILKNDGRRYSKSVEKRTAEFGHETYNVGNAVTIEQNCEKGLWIAQVTQFFQKDEGTDGMHMFLRWFYSRAQLISEFDATSWEATSHVTESQSAKSWSPTTYNWCLNMF